MGFIHTVIADPNKNESGKGDKKNDGKGRDKDGGEDKKKDGEKKQEVEKKEVDEKKEDEQKGNIKIDEVNEVKTDIYNDFAFKNKGDDDDAGFNFAAAGDFGCTSNTKKTVENMKKSDPELVLSLGDLSYQKSANCWFDIMSPLKNKIMVTLGFHDVNDGKPKLDQYLKSFEMNEPYYSFDYRKAHFIVMASESPSGNGSNQYNFVKQDLEKTTNNTDLNWIIVTSYNPFYSSPSKHTGEKEIRSVYHTLFEKYGVDLVLQAHNHNYQRTYPISFNPDDGSEPIVKHNATTGYNDHNGGTIFAIVGTGGESFYPLNGRAPYVATQLDRFGYLNVEVSNGNPHTSLIGTFLDNMGNEIKDYFTKSKEIK